MQHLDRQLAVHGDRLCAEVGLTAEQARKVATQVAMDVRFLSSEVKDEIRASSPVSIAARYEELVAFQAWSDFAVSARRNPGITRASVVVQNYICFVYLKDACFELVAKHAASDSVASRCCSYLSRGLVRDFRNAFAHANWRYNPSFTGFECWVLTDARDRRSPMRQFEISQADLDFWQVLSRGVAYAAYEQLRGAAPLNR